MIEPHWHEHNPWKDQLIYVTVEELAACWFRIDDPKNHWSMIDIIAHWTQYGDKLDAYIIYNSPFFNGGVRYGRELRHYLSPGFSLPKLIALRNSYLAPKSSP